jgi:hypothetical protein
LLIGDQIIGSLADRAIYSVIMLALIGSILTGIKSGDALQFGKKCSRSNKQKKCTFTNLEPKSLNFLGKLLPEFGWYRYHTLFEGEC